MAAGQTFAVLKGYGFWAINDGTVKVPGLDVGYREAWPTGWEPWVDTANGYQITFRNPRAAITSEERGRIGSVPGGDEGTAIGAQLRSTSFPLLKKISALQSRTITAATQVTTLTVTATITSDTPDPIVTLNGVAHTLTGATTATQTSPTLLATYMRTAANYSPAIPTGATGWTIGGSGTAVTFTAGAVGSRSGAYSFNANGSGATATLTTTTAGHSETEIAELDKNVPMGFMFGLEGVVPANSFFETQRTVRFIAYNVENTANAEHIFRHSGADAIFQPSVTLEALPLPAELSTMVQAGSGFSAAQLDPNKRSNYFYVS